MAQYYMQDEITAAGLTADMVHEDLWNDTCIDGDGDLMAWGRSGQAKVREYIRKAAAASRNEQAAEKAEMPAGTPMATDRQLSYLRSLIARREYTGEGGGYMAIPSDLTTLTRSGASHLIDSLTNRY